MEKEIRRCSRCGCYRDDVEIVNDPYEVEIFGNIVQVPLCETCYNLRCEEV